MGPQYAAKLFLERNAGAKSFEVTLYGSLAATGKGHQTDTAIIEVLSPAAPVEIIWRPAEFLPFHPNGMRFVAKDDKGKTIDDWTVYSVGGGAISEGESNAKYDTPEVYEMESMNDIMK